MYNFKSYLYHYDLLNAPRAHECAQMRPSIGSWGHWCAHTRASQILAEKTINEKVENSIFKYKFLLLG
jgi:hypothetical protein